MHRDTDCYQNQNAPDRSNVNTENSGQAYHEPQDKDQQGLCFQWHPLAFSIILDVLSEKPVTQQPIVESFRAPGITRSRKQKKGGCRQDWYKDAHSAEHHENGPCKKNAHRCNALIVYHHCGQILP